MAGPRDRRPEDQRSSPDDSGSVLKSARLEAALDRAIQGGGTAELFELLERNSGLPGPRPNFDLARALGLTIARHAGRADPLLRALLAAESEFPRIVAALSLASRSLVGVDPRGAMAELERLAEDPHHQVRSGVVEALRVRLKALGEPAVVELAAWTDGYLQAHVALSALADRVILDALPNATPVLDRLHEAFRLADASSRAADRSQGVRTLRSGMPAQIAIIAARFRETLEWLEQAARAERPESREVVSEAIRALRRSKLSDAEAKRLGDALAASAPLPRDPSRIVQGTRKRSKGRR